MAISSLLSASGNLCSPSPDRPGRRTSAGFIADEFYRDPIEALYAHYADPKANSIPLIVTSTFLTEVSRCISIAPSLKSHEDALYSPVLVRSLLALYVMHQIRLYCRPFLRRLYRKLDSGEIPPVTLDFILCYGMSALSENHLTPAKRRFLSSAYLERLNHVALTQLSTNPSIDTPFLMYQICRLHVLYRTGEAFRSFLSLSNKLVLERKYHLIDLLDDGPSDPSKALYHEISLEFKRRVFHDVTSLEHLAGALSGIPSNMALTYAVVQPINDTTLLKLLALPPAEDTFPVLVPCMTHIVSGYPSLIELSNIGHDMASLRAQFPLDSLSQFDLAPYLAINRRLSILHPLLLKEFPLSPWATKDQDYNSPVYTAGVCMVHSTYLMVAIFTNVRNWTFGARAVRPEAYPELRAQASKAVDFYTTNCVPLIQQLPPPSHNIIVSVACLLSAFWCITRLHYQADMPDLVHRDLLTIRLYIDIVETFEPYVAYLSSMKKILEIAFREVLAACPGLIPAQLIRRSNLTIETV
ncbi:hypothetical protein IWQ60_007115 [Tieghemiomyces parasiticus]|uniref:Uncharacterized protein n=1 Tax=Tieghemiomyces parasiticus TaxID=78921 RepID=A0A9W8DVG1_9FUNG|nr:hypothetical protein IWQ60_007115 [Tieghemiomyces parasiticus]